MSNKLHHERNGRQEKITGDAKDVLKFYQNRYYFKIALAILSIVASMLGIERLILYFH